MVLVDTSVWVQHFRQNNPYLGHLLSNDLVLCHPFVLLEIACGSPPSPRQQTLAYLGKLQKIKTATTTEVLNFIESHDLYESGCGAVDISLLASVLITPNAKLWTLDKKLHALAIKTKVAFEPLTQ